MTKTGKNDHLEARLKRTGIADQLEPQLEKTGADYHWQVRLNLAERAIADATARIAELTSVVAKLTALRQPFDGLAHESVVLDPDTVGPFATGFYEREFDTTGRPYRWTGKGQIFELRFAANRNFDWSFAMQIGPNARVDIATLRGFVDYAEVAIQIDSAAGFVCGVIPARPFATMAVVSFYLPDSFVPASVDPKLLDSRTLGLVFYGFRAEPRTLDTKSVVEKDASGANQGVRRVPKPGDGDTSASRLRRNWFAIGHGPES